jgi:hypothetical protein
MGCEGCTKLLRGTSYDIKLFSQTDMEVKNNILHHFMPLDSSNPRNLNKTPVYTNHFLLLSVRKDSEDRAR